MEKAVADFESARKEYEAVSELARQARERVNAVLQDMDASRKTVSEKTAALEEVKEALQAADVISPVDGVLLSARVKPGEPVDLTMEDLFAVGVDLHELRATVEPDPPVVAKLKPGLPALVQILDYSRDAIEAEIGAVEDGKVVVHFTSPNPAVRPGMPAVVKIRIP
jgi:HlyD family secretion protein